MRLAAAVLLPVMLLLLLPGLSPAGSAGIGAGSRMTVESQTQMLFQQGGGYVNWEISGPVAPEVRRNVDRGFGDGDGNVTPAEAQSYTNEVDLVLENYIFYGSARIVRSSLLNKDIQTDTAGLIGPVNSSRAIEIHFTFSANLRIDGTTVDFGDLRIPTAAFRALKGEPNQTFEGELEWRHTEIVVGMASFSAINPDRGQFSRLRGPGFEVLWYGLSGRNVTSRDQARFDTFSVVQCPLELFVVLCVFGLMALWFPRHFVKVKKMHKVRWLHLLAILLVVIAVALFLTGADGVVIWVVAPLFAVLSYVLSWGIYAQRWKGIAKSAVPELPVRARADAARGGPGRDVGGGEAGPPPISQVRTAREWADHLPVVEGMPVDEGAGRSAQAGPGTWPGASAAPSRPPPAAGAVPPGPPAPGARPPAPGFVPAPGTQPPAPGAQPAPGNRRDLRCPKCKGTFEVDDPGTRPLPIKCTHCGAEGVLRK